MIVRDWREASRDLLAPVYESERRRWLRELRWDAAPIWREVEQARTTWGLPGVLALDDAGQVCGTAFYVCQDQRLEIGGLSADRGEATRALVDAVLEAAYERRARLVRALLFDAAPGLAALLAERGFTTERHLYLSLSIAYAQNSGSGPQAFEPWRADDVPEAAALFRRAYDPATGALFAPGHGQADWERYTRNLIDYAACGVFNAATTRVLREGGRIQAAALVTDIAPGVAHIVQLAVDPALRGRGMGARLLGEACSRLSGRGYSTVTLLVAETNRAARAIYDRAGFRHAADFVAAVKTVAE
jgi:ribosomal protein S18 acetylase RimI-like enzyme